MQQRIVADDLLYHTWERRNIFIQREFWHTIFRILIFETITDS